MGAEHNMARRIQLRRDTAANWFSTNPTLAQGEIGIDLTNNKIKIGTGTTAWNSLSYWDDQETASIGAFEFAGNVITTNDSSNVIINQVVEIKSDLLVAGNLEPTINLNSSLGSPTRQWRDIFVSNGSVYIGDIKLSNDNGQLIVQQVTNPGQANEAPVPGPSRVTTDRLTNGVNTFVLLDDGTVELNGDPFGPVQPYLELTNEPFITQPVTLGTPVTVTAAPRGVGAEVVITITEGSVLDSITIFEPGTGYVVGQRYKVYYYQIGGPDDASSITLTIGTVDGNGGILTIANAAFVGTPANATSVYTTALNYQASVFDEIDTGLTLTRDVNQGLYNVEAETEYDNNTYLSPLGTEWNADGWGDLTGIGTRTYTTWRSALNNQVGNEIVASELVMHDTINDKYYKFDFTAWGGDNGSFAYTRTLVEDPNYFKKDDYATANNVDVIEDDSTLQIGITRGTHRGLYNPFTEEGWNENVSPQGTVWNIDGWTDLSNIETRTYDNLYAAFGENNLGDKIVGTECVMYVPSIEKYYAIQFLSWTQGDQGGGFSYTRKEIDLTKVNEGVKFPDGTVLKSAQGIGRVKSTATGNRRIEEVTGYNQVTVTERTTGAAVTSTAAQGNELALGFVNVVVSSPQQTALNAIVNSGAFYDFEVSLNQTNWFSANYGGSGFSGGNLYFQLNLRNGVTLPVAQGATVYYRITTGSDPVVWWNKTDLPGGAGDFRGAVIDYHAYTGDGTIIGTIHIVDDDGEEHISHQEVQSGSTDGENDDLWLVTSEGQIRYRRIDGESATLKIHWTAKVFYGSEYYDD